ncbi:MAG TPA: FmdE family protein [Smithella sp.]|nr:FmdE family protein [Smithella sp.]
MHRRSPKIISKPLKQCVLFHGHLCPGLVYGYRVAREAERILKIKRSRDEEIVVVCENDSCAVDAFQVLLGATAGKGNLIIKDYGKNAYTVINRAKRNAYRFVRKTAYEYSGAFPKAFEKLDARAAEGKASEADWKKLKHLKAMDLLNRPIEEIFSISEVRYQEPPYAKLARSAACAQCGEMTMVTKMIPAKGRRKICIPCSEKTKKRMKSEKSLSRDGFCRVGMRKPIRYTQTISE